MAEFPQFIDNNRKELSDVLRQIAPNYKTLSIATGYWDLPGTLEIIKEIENYDSIRLLIGQEPLSNHLQKRFHLNLDSGDGLFPDSYIKDDLEEEGNSKELSELRQTAKTMVTLIKNGKLDIRVYRKPRLHAKAYIFGELGDGHSVGIIGSSNFTKAGLTSNSELNFLTDDYKIVEFEPKTENQENGHLTWFNELWDSDGVEDWNGDFTEIIGDSPVGDKTYGPYDVYIRTLMEVFPDELVEAEPFDESIEKILHPFQNQNALSLRRKLDSMGVAMLSDSVGLGKTITAAAIIKQYIEDGKYNIVIIPPAALKQQWVDELESDRWNLMEHRDFEVYSQQDGDRIQQLIDKSEKRQGTHNEIDLFVVDEAHNLRNAGTTRHNQILTLFQENPNAKVLLLTATPINNSLMDFANQIQLGSKGDLVSVNVPYSTGKGSLEYIDFFEALKRIQSEATKADKKGEKYDWSKHKNTLTTGIRHYLVRATRQGVIKRNAMKPVDGQTKLFPDTVVKQFEYGYLEEDAKLIQAAVEGQVAFAFDNLNPLKLNLDFASQITQRTKHPLDLFKEIKELQDSGNAQTALERNDVSDDLSSEKLFDDSQEAMSVISSIYKIINFLGFSPYKPDSYNWTVYGKTIPEIRQLNLKGREANSLRVQLAIHNMLHVTWLKRLESSTHTLAKSVENYSARIKLFEKWLDKGFIVSLSDAALLGKEYGDDIERAFEDYDEYLKELDTLVDGDETTLKKRGVERKLADIDVFNIAQLQKDIERDKALISLLEKLLGLLTKKGHDEKLNTLANRIIELASQKKYGEKLLVFSFFSDTVDYLREALPPLLDGKITNFSKRAAFVSGNSTHVENIARLFSPNSKKYVLKSGETELDYLFATDVLSEGQNLQDAGALVNYDLHWNPVRMIQRNGRVNRLGSHYNEVLIANARPNDDLEMYLKLVRRLENKIEAINNTVGNDQSILGEKENPIEFNDFIGADDIYSTDAEKATAAVNALENQKDILDWADDYALELRAFIDDHSGDDELSRLKGIPIGKWNYLPQKNQEVIPDTNEVYALFSANGRMTGTNELVHDTGFVKIAKTGANRGPFSQVRASYVDDQDALAKIKTTPDDNQAGLDLINVDRQEYLEKGRVEINAQFESNRTLFDVKPAQAKALSVLSEYFNQDLLHLVQTGIRKSNDKRSFEKLVRKVNKEVKENGMMNATTVRSFEKFINHLLEIETQEKKLEEAKGVLFYANNQ